MLKPLSRLDCTKEADRYADENHIAESQLAAMDKRARQRSQSSRGVCAADFKLGVLNSYIAHGWRLWYAFGDSPTDFIAYQRAGLPRERVFALKRKWRDSCEEGVYSACLDGWSEFLQTVTIEPAVVK